jgi:hypothetical protein
MFLYRVLVLRRFGTDGHVMFQIAQHRSCGEERRRPVNAGVQLLHMELTGYGLKLGHLASTMLQRSTANYFTGGAYTT